MRAGREEQKETGCFAVESSERAVEEEGGSCAAERERERERERKKEKKRSLLIVVLASLAGATRTRPGVLVVAWQREQLALLCEIWPGPVWYKYIDMYVCR